VTPAESYIITTARHFAYMQRWHPDFRVVRGGWEVVAELARGLNGVCFEEDRLPVTVHAQLTAAGVRMVPSAGLLEDLRSVKTEEEVSAIRRACGIVDGAFQHVQAFIRPGRTEQEIAAEIDVFTRSHGSADVAFKTLVSSGARCYYPHSAATSKRVEDGDFVLMDFGAVHDGYRADITRTVAVGHADERQRRMYRIVQTAQQMAVDAIRAGVFSGDVDAVARDFITANTEQGCYDYGLGHGVGLEVHERPFMTPGSRIVLQAGHVVSVEPGIYIPEWGGIRIEDTVLVRDGGAEPLTKSTKDLIIL
jgi:Xaa-Pro aminopeptidase